VIDHRAWLACQNVENRYILLLHWLGVTLVLDRQADLPLGLQDEHVKKQKDAGHQRRHHPDVGRPRRR